MRDRLDDRGQCPRPARAPAGEPGLRKEAAAEDSEG
jgi:hypothetical protein